MTLRSNIFLGILCTAASLNAMEVDTFPALISYQQMSALANGETIDYNGTILKAVDPQVIGDKMPSRWKQAGRSLLAAAWMAEAPGAALVGSLKCDGQTTAQSYCYTPAANMGHTFQFSLYVVEAVQNGEEDKDYLGFIKELDARANRAHDLGPDHVAVKKDALAEKADSIKRTQLATVMRDHAKYKTKYANALKANDNITAEYLGMIIRKIEAEIVAIDLKLYFLSVTGPGLLAKDEMTTPESLIETMDTTIRIQAVTSTLFQSQTAYRLAHKGHITENIGKY